MFRVADDEGRVRTVTTIRLHTVLQLLTNMAPHRLILDRIILVYKSMTYTSCGEVTPFYIYCLFLALYLSDV